LQVVTSFAPGQVTTWVAVSAKWPGVWLDGLHNRLATAESGRYLPAEAAGSLGRSAVAATWPVYE
jgi:hypothetical protein